MKKQEYKDFTQGVMWKNILYMAIPITLAQVVQLLYNLVDRIYIGHMPEDASLALTGLGLTFPIISLILAFTSLYASGGAPLFSIERGRGHQDRAAQIMGNCFLLLLVTALVLMVFFYVFMRPILFLFGASYQTYPFASRYMQIYLLGTVFVMITAGMNPFINAQGFSKIGMGTTMLGAVCNIALDPLFIFVLHMGVRGAAVATVISQCISAVWVLHFLCGDKAEYRIEKKYMKIKDGRLILRILGLGVSGFVMAVTNSLTQIVCNASLQQWGGDVYVGSMTILNSVREVMSLAVQGMTQGAQPVLGYNYGARKFERVKKGIVFTSGLTICYTVLAWAVITSCPGIFVRLFTHNEKLISVAIPSLKLFFAGFFMMSLQFSGQSTFVALGCSKQAVFFSLLRKVIIVVPLTLILPHFVGVNGVFLAEPVSNYIGGTASFVTMLLTVWPMLKTSDTREETYR